MVFALLTAVTLAASPLPQDADGCKDYPMFNRMPNYDIYSCKTVDFDAIDIVRADRKYETVEGKVVYVSYKLKDGVTPPSALQVVRNFQNAAKSAGGQVLGDYSDNSRPNFSDSQNKYMVESAGGTAYTRYSILKLTKGASEYWVTLAASEEYRDYSVLIVERQVMTQAVAVNELVDKLNKDGFIALYVNFETNRATITVDSAKILDDAASVLKATPAMNVIVGGHTDTVGTAEANQKLSAARAQAVVDALVQRGIDARRLTAQGFGQSMPVADNRTEDGRAKNRRVELVKNEGVSTKR
jgi:outer membrane protein OmpA-like peptidoglycan-associated protein